MVNGVPMVIDLIYNNITPDQSVYISNGTLIVNSTCSLSQYLYKGTCLTKCPNGLYGDNTTRACQ